MGCILRERQCEHPGIAVDRADQPLPGIDDTAGYLHFIALLRCLYAAVSAVRAIPKAELSRADTTDKRRAREKTDEKSHEPDTIRVCRLLDAVR